MKPILMCLVFALLFSCKDDTKAAPITADDVVDKSIEVSGGQLIGKAQIKFMFRDYSYTAYRKDGIFEISRLQKKGNQSILDFVNNSGYKRLVNGLTDQPTDSMANLYAASINSVHYFSVLPYGLTDKAVNKTLLTEEQIKGVPYYKVKVTFDKSGGGEDYEDVFIYWFDKSTYKLNYLAYSYSEPDGVGLRFRSAYNERYVNGVRFVDYLNYKPKNPEAKLESLGKTYGTNRLELVSKIELKSITVRLLYNENL